MRPDKDFDFVKKDPRFRGSIKKKKYVKETEIDDRFKHLESQTVYKDKRGRPWMKNPTAYANELLKYKKKEKNSQSKPMHKQKEIKEEMTDEEEEVMTDEEKEEMTDEEKEIKEESKKNIEEEEEEEEQDNDDDEEEAMDLGEVSDEDISGTESENTDDEDRSSDFDSDGERGVDEMVDLLEVDWSAVVPDDWVVEEPTSRLFLFHFDWDKCQPQDIYLVLASFLPKNGVLKRVTVYPSKFGMERMAEDNTLGPRELRGIDDDEPGTSGHSKVEEDDNEGNSVEMRRRIRRYQLARLKYFYGVIEFESAMSASVVHEQCDGMEYENSGVHIDLRFVAEKVQFEVPEEWSEMVTSCTDVDGTTYKPRMFETSALRSTNLKVTWGENPQERGEWFRSTFHVEDFEKLDDKKVQQYVACSDSDSEEDEEAGPSMNKAARKERVRELLLETADQNDLADMEALYNESDDDMMDFPVGGDDVVQDLQPEKKDEKEKKKSAKKIETKEEPKDSPKPKISKKQKLRLKKKEKMELKMKKPDELENAWDDEDDDRFDEFFTDSRYTVTGTHPDFEEAATFNKFIKKRKEMVSKTT